MKLILTLILTKWVTNPSMMTSRIFNPYNNLRRNQFMIYLISEKWWVGLKDSPYKSISKQTKCCKDKKNNNFWCRKRYKFTKRMDKS